MTSAAKPEHPKGTNSQPPAATGLHIREATAADVAAILQLYEVAGITGEAAFTVQEGIAQLQLFATYPFYRVYVAVNNEDTLGTYELLLMDNFAKRGAKTAIVEDVAVDPKAQGQGVGRAMMLHAQDVAAANGAYKLALSSNLRRTKAHDFYRALGFVQHGLSFVVQLAR